MTVFYQGEGEYLLNVFSYSSTLTEAYTNDKHPSAPKGRRGVRSTCTEDNKLCRFRRQKL